MAFFLGYLFKIESTGGCMTFCKTEEYVSILEKQISEIRDITQLRTSDLLANLTDEAIVSLFALGKEIEKKYKISNIADLASHLNVPMMTENRTRKKLLMSLLIGDSARLLRVQYQQLSENYNEFSENVKSFFRDFSSFLGVRTHSGAYIAKCIHFFSKLREEKNYSYKMINRITGVNIEALQKYEKSNKELIFNEEKNDERSEQFIKNWEEVPPHIRNRIDHVISYMQAQHPEYSSEFIRQMTLKLGLRAERSSSKHKSPGAHSLQTFQPLSCASADGKHLNIKLNGESFHFVWYPFVCGSTKLFLGSSLENTENSEAFLKALKDVNQNIGHYPIAIVIDNRLSKTGEYHIDDQKAKEEIPQDILSFLKEHNIILIKTFKGNPKSNTIENSFSTFQKHAVDLNFDFRDKNNEEIARELATKSLKMYMNVQNAKPRKRYNGRSAEDLCRNAIPSEGDRPALQKLKERHQYLEDKNKTLIEKGKILYTHIPDGVRKHFVFKLSQGEPSERFYKNLASSNIDEIINVSSIFAAVCEKYPLNKYEEAYFLGILYNVRSEAYKKTYSETYLSGCINAHSYFNNIEPKDSIDEIAKKLVKDIAEIGNNKDKHHRTYYLNEFCSFLLFISVSYNLFSLWENINQIMVKKSYINATWHCAVVKHIFERIGPAIAASRGNNGEYINREDFFEKYFGNYKKENNEKLLNKKEVDDGFYTF